MFGQAMQDVATVLGGGMPIESRRQCEQTLVRQYHACLVEFGVTGYSYEQCWRDYVFQLVLPFLRLLVMAPGLARDRRKRIGMFAPTLTPAAQKLTEMYKQLNSRLAQALIDHQWWERVLELPITAAWCCRPCC